MSAGDAGYRVDQLPRVLQQIRDLVAKARPFGLVTTLLKSLTSALDHLKSDPLGWGDPAYRTQTAGGIVCRGISRPIVVYYVVFESSKSVIVLDIFPFPGDGLD